MLQHKLCGVPLLNITEFIFNTDPKKIAEAQFWFKFSLTFFEKVDPDNIDRSLILLAYLCSTSKQNARAEALFRIALGMLEEKDTYNKVLCMQLLGNMLKQQEQTEEEGRSSIFFCFILDFIAKAYQVAEDLPFWSNKLCHLLIPEMDL